MSEKWHEELKIVATVYQTGATALSYSLAPKYAYQLLEIKLHNGSTPTTSENLTITMDANQGSAYDTNIYTKDMAGIKDLVWAPDVPLYFDAGDQLDFAWANTDTVTYGLTIRYRRVR